MNVVITGRHFDVTNPIKAYATEKIQRLEKFFPKILEAHIILTVEKYRRIVEITLIGKHLTVTGKETTADMYASIDKALETIDKQLRKFSERMKEHKKKKAHEVESDAISSVSLGSQALALGAAANPGPKIVETRRLAEKPMSVEEAASELSISNGEFLVFRNSDDEKINVIYKRKDGDLGLIKP